MTKKLARGIRNCNPGNIDRAAGVRWQGQALDQTSDPRFVVFEHPKWGIRAIARVLITYQDKRRAADGSKIDTVREIVERWAPPSENDTGAYARQVARALGVDDAETVDVYDYATMRALVLAIIKHENGVQPYDDATIDEGLRLAGIEPPLKPISQSRTLKAQTAAAAAVTGAGVLEALNGAKAAIEPLIPHLDVAKYVLLGIVLVSVAVTVYARLDDRRTGKA